MQWAGADLMNHRFGRIYELGITLHTTTTIYWQNFLIAKIFLDFPTGTKRLVFYI
jgi:hypothetical protein